MLGYSVEKAFEQVGIDDAQVTPLLVGFKLHDETEFHVVLGQESRRFAAAVGWRELERLTGDRFWNHEDIDSFHSDPKVDELARRSRLRSTRGAVMAELVENACNGLDKFRFFAGQPAEVYGFEVYPLVGVDEDAYGLSPQLKTSRRDRFAITQSLAEGILRETLSAATRALYQPNAGDSFSAIDFSPSEVVQRAAARFVSSAFFCAGYSTGHGSDDYLTAVASLPYEGRPGNGRIIIAREASDQVEIHLRLLKPVDLHNTRAVRKLLEATAPGADLLISDGKVLGYGRLRLSFDLKAEDVFCVEMRGRGQWRLTTGAKALLSVRDGRPQIPKSDLDRESFIDLCDRLFTSANVVELERIVEAASAHTHGAMIVISDQAAEEAKRLSVQAWQVEPVQLTDEQVRQFVEIDGAILLDPSGMCHGIGVILDGLSRRKGDPARGSRFNNAVRYLEGVENSAIVVVLSADATIDVLPKISRRVSRCAVERAVAQLADYADQLRVGEDDDEEAKSSWSFREPVERYSFYLNQGQCDRANRAFARIHEVEMTSSQFSLIPQSLHPNPEMNDSYFWPEGS